MAGFAGTSELRRPPVRHSLSVQARVLFYNKNIFDRFGVPYPQAPLTWREFIEIAKKVTYVSDNPYDSIYGIVKLSYVDIFGTLRGEYFSEDGTRVLIDGERMVRAVQLHRDLADRHCVRLNDDEFTELSGGRRRQRGDVSQELFAQGRFAMIVRPKSLLSYLRQVIDHQRINSQSGKPTPTAGMRTDRKSFALGPPSCRISKVCHRPTRSPLAPSPSTEEAGNFQPS